MAPSQAQDGPGGRFVFSREEVERTMIRTTRVTGGIKVEVIRDTTRQVSWQKFVPWKNLDRLPEVFEYASREQNRHGKTEDATSDTTGHGGGPQDEQHRPVRE